MLLLICILGAGAWYWYQKEQQGEFEWLIETQFEEAGEFYAGVAWVQDNTKRSWKLINKNGNIIVDDSAQLFMGYRRIC